MPSSFMSRKRSSGAREFVETPHCVVPPGLDLRESYPALPCRATDCPVPSGLIGSGHLRFFSIPLKPSSFAASKARLKLSCPDTKHQIRDSGRVGAFRAVPFVRRVSAGSFSKLEVDEVAMAEEAKEDDGVEAGVVGQGTKGWPCPDSWSA